MDKPKIAQKSPYIMTMEPGLYRWCACGLSNTQPFCDDSHYGTGIEPISIRIEEEKEVWWCGCKQSGTKPFCDDTHKKI